MYDTNYGAVRDYCLRRLDVSDVNDAVAEVFLTVWRRLDDVPTDGETLPWLFGVARNTVANVRRSGHRWRRLRVRLDGLASRNGDSPETQIVRRNDTERALAALAELSDRDREILLLKAWEGLSHQEIGLAMDLTTGAVDARVSRARKRLERLATTSRVERPRSSSRGRAR